MSVDHQNKRVFAGECKYHAKPVDAQVYFALKEKVNNATEIRKAFPGYEVIYGVFSKSGFTQRMLDIAKEVPIFFWLMRIIWCKMQCQVLLQFSAIE